MNTTTDRQTWTIEHKDSGDGYPWLVFDQDGEEVNGYECQADATEAVGELESDQEEEIAAEAAQLAEEAIEQETAELVEALTDRIGGMGLTELRELAKRLKA